MRYTPPSGWYYNYPKHKKPAASLERKLNYTGEERLLAKEWYEQQLANYPDVPVSYTHLDVYKRQRLYRAA